MKILWCWRCRMELPMLDEEEYGIAYRLYGEGFARRKAGMSHQDSMQPLLDYNKEVTGMEETEPNAIMHHRIAQYGPPAKAAANRTVHQKLLFALLADISGLLILNRKLTT